MFRKGRRRDVLFFTQELSTLLNKEFRPKSDEAKTAVQSAVQTLAQQALSQTKLVSGDGSGGLSRQ